VLGLAVTLRDERLGEQDVLLATAGSTVVGRRLFRTATTPLGDTFYSSVMTVAVAGERLLVGAHAETGPSPAPRSLDELAERAGSPVTLRLVVARPTDGWYSLGRLVLGRRLTDVDVRFRPTRTWPRVTTGPAQHWRDRFYVASAAGENPGWLLRALGARAAGSGAAPAETDRDRH
jgi:hypothetical protein